MKRIGRLLVGVATMALTTGVLTLAAPGAAHAEPTRCEANSEWYKTSTTKTYLKVNHGDGKLWSAPSTAPLKVSENLTKTVTIKATYTGSVGGNLEIGVPVRGFNVAGNLGSTGQLAMEVESTHTMSVTTNVTVPAGHTFLQYAGHRMTKATVTKYRCNSRGTAVSTAWSGTLNGPRWPVAGYIDCKDTSLC